jgi:hypothetical protein
MSPVLLASVKRRLGVEPQQVVLLRRISLPVVAPVARWHKTVWRASWAEPSGIIYHDVLAERSRRGRDLLAAALVSLGLLVLLQ